MRQSKAFQIKGKDKQGHPILGKKSEQWENKSEQARIEIRIGGNIIRMDQNKIRIVRNKIRMDQNKIRIVRNKIRIGANKIKTGKNKNQNNQN